MYAPQTFSCSIYTVPYVLHVYTFRRHPWERINMSEKEENKYTKSEPPEGLSVYAMMFPCSSRGFLFHPVENNGPMSNRGSGCASVFSTILSSGSRSLGEKSR